MFPNWCEEDQCLQKILNNKVLENLIPTCDWEYITMEHYNKVRGEVV